VLVTPNNQKVEIAIRLGCASCARTEKQYLLGSKAGNEPTYYFSQDLFLSVAHE
jgi:hypothetical protein